MTTQIPDEVRYQGAWYGITAVDGTGLFDPEDQGLTPEFLSTGCWRGFQCRYQIQDGQLILDEVHMGKPSGDQVAGKLFGVKAERAGRKSSFPGALRYRRLATLTPFTGRLLLGADYVWVGYLNMGFQPAWLYARVHEVAFEAGRLTSAQDRSAALAEVRHRLGADGLRPAAGELSSEWIDRTFSLTFDYSWPTHP
jgi:hypothetical protein